MDSSLETSFLRLVRDISKATNHRRESETDYEGLLQKIFEKGIQRDSLLRWDWEGSSRQVNTTTKGGLHDTKHSADPEAEKVFGREQAMRMLLFKCCEKRTQLFVIPIVGATGIGKTTLARVVYDHELVLKHFEMRVWVEVDGLELNLHHAAQLILKSAMGMSCSVDDDLDEMVQDILLGKRCLIVFDGVESIAQDLWLHMNNNWFHCVDVGSRVLITTSSEDVANIVSNEALMLKQLPPDDGWSLYRHFAGGSSHTEDTSRNLEGLCGYIPLLLKLVGSMMTYHDNLRRLLSKVHVSDAINSLPTFDASVAILFCLWALPPELRQCLAFCAIFPKGHVLNREKIINMWAAHGLLEPSPKKRPPLDIGNLYFHQLLCRSFFTDIARNDYGDITEFRMPGLIHPIMQDVAKIFWDGKVGAIGFVNEDADQLSVHLEGPDSVGTLILSSSLYSGATSQEYSFHYFQKLESLDLSGSGIRNLSDDICSLRELRYLNLSYTLIETLPDSIKGLRHLQTLDFSWCYHFKVLPKAIHYLKYVSHLDLFQCESLSYLPSEIGFLVSLTTMPLFVLGKDHDCARLGKLGLLNKLSGRLEIRNLENVEKISEARDAKLNKKIKLRQLGLCWSKHVDPDGCFQVLKFLKPNQQLKVLDITGYTGFRFPGWIRSMSILIKISITDCGCKVLPSLGQLPLLKELHLKGMTNIRYIGPEFYGDGVTTVEAFPSLEQLGLYDMPELFHWSGAMVSGDVFRSMKTLTIEGCPLLDNNPTFRNPLDLIVCNSNDGILSCRNWTRLGSPSSLLVKDMELQMFLLDDSTKWRSLKKLILFNCTLYSDNTYLRMYGFNGLEHLGIAHCPQVREIELGSENSIQKLHFVDCPNLEEIYFLKEATKLTELVVDGCPGLQYLEITSLRRVTKLIIRGCDELFIMARDFKALGKLEYLSISECPGLEKELEMEPSLISHIPCVLLGNRKDGVMRFAELIVQSSSAEFNSFKDLFSYLNDKAKCVGDFNKRHSLCSSPQRIQL